MAKGRKPKSVERKILEGNPGKRVLPAVTSVGGKGEITKPWYLSEGAGLLWDEFVPVLNASGLLDRADSLLLAQFFEAMSMSITAVEQLSKAGIVQSSFSANTGDEVLKAHPAVGVWKKAVETMDKIGSKFGLSPSDRARFSVASGGESGFVDPDFGEPVSLQLLKSDEPA